MYISKIELKGFKSFANKTRVQLSSGITGVVGPNGCGKSNIVDALRWVLGEQRASQLRSSAMASVIFNGTKNRKKAGFAEVALTIDNNRGLLPSEFEEITITRRLFRSGQSEYLLNGTACRLKDINELFVDTGLNTNAYSVIELKAVEGIVDDKNNERRKLFEEAAGVTRYKEKRKDTYKKLSETREDLQRLSDILIIMEKKVRSLETQSRKARRLKELQQELLELDQQSIVFEHKKLNDELNPLAEQQKQAENERESLTKQLEQAEKHLSATRGSSSAQLDAEELANKEYIRLQEQYNEAKTHLRVTEQQLDTEAQRLAQLQREITEAQARLEEVDQLHTHSSGQFEQLDQELEAATAKLESSKEHLDDALLKFNEQRRLLSARKEEERRLQAEFNKQREQYVRLQAQEESKQQRLKQLTTQQEQSDTSITEANKQVEESKKHTADAEKLWKDAEEGLKSFQEQWEDLESSWHSLRNELGDAAAKLKSVEAEYKMLRHMMDSGAFNPEYLQQLLSKKEQIGLPKMQLLIEQLQVDSAHAAYLERALGEWTNVLVLESEDQMEALKQHVDRQQVPVLVLDAVPHDAEVLEGSLYHHVTADVMLDSALRYVLGKTMVLQEGVSPQDLFAKGAEVVLSSDGSVHYRSGISRIGKASEQAGARAGLKQRLADAEKKLKQAQEGKEAFKQRLDQLQEERNVLSSQKSQRTEAEKQARGKFEEQSRLLHRKEVELDNTLKSLEIADKEKKDLEQTIHSILSEIATVQESYGKSEQAINDFSSQAEDFDYQLQLLEEEKNLAQKVYNETRLRHQDLSNKRTNLERDSERSKITATRLNQQIIQKKSDIQTTSAKEKELKEALQSYQLQQEESRMEVNRAAQELKEIKEENASLRGAIRQLEEEVRDIQRKKEVNTDLIHHLSMAKQNVESRIKQLTERVWEDYNKLVRQLEVQIPDDFQLEPAKQRLKVIRSKIQNIGQVNELAIDEYEEEKEKLDFYHKQIKDLEEAEADLLQTLEEINQTAIERFNTTFEQIRENFQKVFKTLFNEDDECDLLIDTEAEDILEARIKIVARPKGKRPSNISQLSGGEKTLTATALLFAIYLVKPSPFCVLDEVDAPLDDANIERFAHMVKQFSDETQFIIVTHNKNTMANAERLYGVTMVESGISQLVSVDVSGLDVEEGEVSTL